MPANKELLLIFVKNPDKGRVKTRLARGVGDAKALAVYQDLLQITKSVADQIEVHRQVWYSRHISCQDLWAEGGYAKHIQQGEGLGQRMKGAFRKAYADGFKKAVIIGSDCAELEPHIIRRAYRQLDDRQVVIGPARDGGYYLLGMAGFYPALFDGKEWSSSSVCAETVRQLEEKNIPYRLLPTLNDIDTEADLIESNKLPSP